MRQAYITRILFTLLALVSASGAFSDPGRPAPACQLSAFDGSAAVDTRQLRGKVVYVDFWASWCSQCAKSFPFLNALDKEFRDRGLYILGVNLDDDIESAKDFLARRPASFALARDLTQECPRNFGVEAMPSSYLVDRQGQIRHVVVGFRSGETEQVRQIVQQLLAEEPAEPLAGTAQP